MTVKIMKFGGSSFCRADCYRFVSDHIVHRLATDADQAVIVVSAMYGVTDSLKALAFSVNERCDGAALDTVLTTGEIVSVGLLEAALKRYSVPVSSLFGYTLGIETSSGFNRACIDNIDNASLGRALQTSRVVLVAGAQAVDKGGRISMLGRNSSDLTAVIVADMAGSSSCEIYSDVCGVYTADPRFVKQARLVPAISYASVSRIARRGARVLHYGAVEYASAHGIEISCKSLLPEETVGTVVGSVGEVATVVIDRSAARLKFRTFSELQGARALLKALDITWVDVNQDDGYDVYLSHDIDSALNKFSQNGIKPLDLSKTILVTEIDKDRETTFEFEDLDSAVCCAQTLHENLYPEDEQSAVMCDMRQAGAG